MPTQHLSFFPTAALLSTLLPSLILASPGFDCSNIVRDGGRWNLKELGGARSVHWIRPGEPTTKNFTFTMDICRPLLRHRGVPAQDECPGNTRVCGIDYSYNKYDNITIVDTVVPIAGDYHLKTGQPLDSEVHRLKSTTHDKEGLRVELSGGRAQLDEKKSTKQKAIIEFLCDANTDGTDTEKAPQGDEDGNDKDADKLAKRDDEKDDNKDEKSSPMQFLSYKDEDVKGENWGVLRIEWRTKYACEKAINEPLPSSGSSWGFFTWFIIILFLGIAAYLIFGSWLNYNRYGARGWDLLPHGDTIRDIPYIVKDFGRRVVGTVQGGGARGGYSAV